MIVVSNTSPIINLAVIDHLNLLHQLYGEVIIPRTVYNEIVTVGEGQPGSADIKGASWIAVKEVTNQALVTALRLDLDDGEAEAITLAVELEADLLLIDERKGRRLADALGCQLTCQRMQPVRSQPQRQAGGGFGHSAFLVIDGNDSAHVGLNTP